MAYSKDLQERVVSFVEAGGKKTEAARLFNVHRDTIYAWLARRGAPTPVRPKFRHRKLDKAGLERHAQEHPDALLRERALLFSVTPAAISYAFKALDIRKKKRAAIKSDAL